MSATRFLERCRMTCFGGSEKGTCPCPSPGTCEEQGAPEYQHYRNEAIARMNRYLMNGLGSTSASPVQQSAASTSNGQAASDPTTKEKT